MAKQHFKSNHAIGCALKSFKTFGYGEEPIEKKKNIVIIASAAKNTDDLAVSFKGKKIRSQRTPSEEVVITVPVLHSFIYDEADQEEVLYN